MRQVIPFASDLEWSTLGAVPEMLQTAFGSLTVGLDAQPGQSILIRGGTSSVGMAAAVLATRRNMTVLSTTRSANKKAALTDIGVDHVVIDDGNVAGQVREILPARGRHRSRARRDADAAGHVARDSAARGRLLHRDAVQCLDSP
jgi:NADPH:quinone reductase-like Zn-dependent oxidoreductase